MFASKEKKERKQAAEWTLLAKKVYAYRKDILPEDDRETLRDLIERMDSLLKDKTSPLEGIRLVKKEGEPVLRRCGGHFYPKSFIAENSEMLLFAAILAIGIRTFFFQPFKIPTNSMFPSYNGMTAEVYAQEDPPAAPVKAFRFLTLGARHYDVATKEGGTLSVSTDRRVVDGRKWFILPAKKFRYTFYVGNTPVPVDLPLEFDIRQVLDPLLKKHATGRKELANGTTVMATDLEAAPGETAFAFDLLTGDQLFVDRFSYHFKRPRVGDPIVFRTDNLEYIDEGNRGKYYIKRAVGGPGDTLRIDPPDIIRNGEPITGADAFIHNRKQEKEFSGYTFGQSSGNYPRPRAAGRKPIEVPQKHYFAMGDNSPNSADGRMWGFVPQEEIVGKAVFIYFPFSHRWGPAK